MYNHGGRKREGESTELLRSTALLSAAFYYLYLVYTDGRRSSLVTNALGFVQLQRNFLLE